jgi:hypothetical protein
MRAINEKLTVNMNNFESFHLTCKTMHLYSIPYSKYFQDQLGKKKSHPNQKGKDKIIFVGIYFGLT